MSRSLRGENIWAQLLAGEFASALFDVDGLLRSKGGMTVLKAADGGLSKAEQVGKLLRRHFLAQSVTPKRGLFVHD